jgi:hypothetical protein
MHERDVTILEVLRCGADVKLTVQTCNVNSVLKCLLSQEQECLWERLKVGEKVRVCITSIVFTRSEPVICLKVLDFLEEAGGALKPQELLAVSPIVCAVDNRSDKKNRKRIFFDMLQEFI